MNLKQIIVDVSDDGEIHIETTGFSGDVCLKESKFIKDLLGHEISCQLVPTFYMRKKELVKRFLPICG